jgi:hypothetical protein
MKTIFEINKICYDYGFTITNDYDFVLINQTTCKGVLVQKEKINKDIKTINDVWEFITYEGLLNISTLLKSKVLILPNWTDAGE